MYYKGNFEYGIPSRIYRSVGEIRADIQTVSKKIAQIEEQLNIRSLLLELISSEDSSDFRTLIPELYEAIDEANRALSEMNELKTELSSLREELLEVKCVLGD